ncbi:MAG: hypothetical protein H6Q67_174 [Firmicutes bacterium]|nr:hypothetical protein [Bacillota bacterium]
MIEDSSVYFRIARKHVNYVNCIFEGYEYLGVVSTVDRNDNLLVVRATSDTADVVRDILVNLPIPVELVENR